jgi:hypothetical protein
MRDIAVVPCSERHRRHDHRSAHSPSRRSRFPAALRTVDPRPSAPTVSGAVDAPEPLGERHPRRTPGQPRPRRPARRRPHLDARRPSSASEPGRRGCAGSPPCSRAAHPSTRSPISPASKRRKAGDSGQATPRPDRRPSVTRISVHPAGRGTRAAAAPTPSASSHAEAVEKAIALERPSKLGASWASNGCRIDQDSGFDARRCFRREREGRPGQAGPGDDHIGVKIGHG